MVKMEEVDNDNMAGVKSEQKKQKIMEKERDIDPLGHSA